MEFFYFLLSAAPHTAVGFVDGDLNETILWGVEVYVQYGGFFETVNFHMLAYPREDRFILLFAENIFLFDTLEDVLKSQDFTAFFCCFI